MTGTQQWVDEAQPWGTHSKDKPKRAFLHFSGFYFGHTETMNNVVWVESQGSCFGAMCMIAVMQNVLSQRSESHAKVTIVSRMPSLRSESHTCAVIGIQFLLQTHESACKQHVERCFLWLRLNSECGQSCQPWGLHVVLILCVCSMSYLYCEYFSCSGHWKLALTYTEITNCSFDELIVKYPPPCFPQSCICFS